MLTITIASAILLVCILIYPFIKELHRLIQLGQEKQKEDQKENIEKDELKSDLASSIIGKSRFKLSQPVPTATTPIAKEQNIEESVSNFVPDVNQKPMDIDIPLEKEIIEDDNIDEEQEVAELKELFGKDVLFASGVDVNELEKLKHVIETPSAEINEKKQVGKTLYENQETDMVQQMISDNSQTASIISNLIDLHMTNYLKENTNEIQRTADDINDFDINQFLGRK